MLQGQLWHGDGGVDSQRREHGLPCAWMLPLVAGSGGGGASRGSPRRRVSGSRTSTSRSPGSTPPPAESPAREANESAAAAVSCFVAQVRGRAGAAPLHAGFPGTLPLAPLTALRRCLAPPRLLTKGFRVAIRRPDRPPCHLSAASPGGSRRLCFEAQPGGAAARAFVCAALLWSCSCTRAAENPAWSARGPPPGVPAGLRRSSVGPPSAQARAIAHLPRGDPGVHSRVLGPLPLRSLPGPGVLGAR